MDTLFGEGQTGPKILLFLVVVLGLLALAFWLLRRFGGGRLGGASTRGRQPRLAMIDQAAIDNRRRLVLIRRDNVEHLLIIGGPTDVVIEQNIVRAGVPLAPGRPAAATDTLPRAVPLGEDTTWPLQPEPAPKPEGAPRAEPSLRAEPAVAASADQCRRRDPVAGRRRDAGGAFARSFTRGRAAGAQTIPCRSACGPGGRALAHPAGSRPGRARTAASATPRAAAFAAGLAGSSDCRCPADSGQRPKSFRDGATAGGCTAASQVG